MKILIGVIAVLAPLFLVYIFTQPDTVQTKEVKLTLPCEGLICGQAATLKDLQNAENVTILQPQ